MNFAALKAQYDLGDRFERAAVIEALRALQRTTQLPAWASALVPPVAQTPSASVPSGPTLTPLERAIADSTAQLAATPDAFGGLTEAALASALTLDPTLHVVAAQALTRLVAAARALRPAGAESDLHLAWRLKIETLQAEIDRVRVPLPLDAGREALIRALAGAMPTPEPPFDSGGAATVAEHAAAHGAVVALLG